MQQLISWSKNLAVLHFKQILYVILQAKLHVRLNMRIS